MLIVYRACSTGNPQKIRPIEGKFELVKTCFNSFLKAFQDVDCKLVILLDKPTMEFRELFKGFEVEETYYSNFTEGNIYSFHRQIDLANESKDNFFFIEDDYFFLPSSGKIIEKALTDPDMINGFLTPYDHPGYYSEETHNYKKEVKLLGGHHFQSVISTTLTFGGKYKSLVNEAQTMKKYGWTDHPMWCDITQRVPLYAPIPTLATHMETPYLAPGVNWSF